MNVVYLIGIALALLFTMFGIIVNIGIHPGQSPMFTFGFSPDSLWNFVDLSSILIVVGGTLADDRLLSQAGQVLPQTYQDHAPCTGL